MRLRVELRSTAEELPSVMANLVAMGRVLRAVAVVAAVVTLIGSVAIVVIALPAVLFAPPFFIKIGSLFILNAYGSLAVLAASHGGAGNRLLFLVLMLFPNAWVVVEGRQDPDLLVLTLVAASFCVMAVATSLWAVAANRRQPSLVQGQERTANY